jgi:hypothetical protein
MEGPAWLGIGAQRSGTTWLTRLLLQHPKMALSTTGKKELHLLHAGIGEPWSASRAQEYRSLFTDEMAGEFTPEYLRRPWAATRAAQVCRPDCVFIAILRDPVARWQSAAGMINDRIGDAKAVDLRVTEAVWAGMYADQLDVWAHAVGRDRIVVLQYEQAVTDPQGTADSVWTRLGLEPIPVAGGAARRGVSTSDLYTVDDDVRAALIANYAGQIGRLKEWGIDASLWPSFD